MTAHQIIERVDFSNAEDFFDTLTPTHPRWKGLFVENWIFRGQADASWKLIPSILRDAHWLDSADPATRDWLRTIAEFDAVQSFMRVADRAGLAIPEDSQALRTHAEVDQILRSLGPSGVRPTIRWPPRSLLSVVALAQHHGIRTRLLDWTWRPKIAAYFAVREAVRRAKTGRGRSVVWALSRQFVELAWATESDKPIVTAPQATNPNLAAQAGLFTVFRDAHEDVGLEEIVVEKINSGAWAQKPLPVMFNLTLPHSESGRLLRLLALDGISAATVWPNYDGVARALAEEGFHEK